VTPLVALLTDFGHSDAYAGVMKGVILARNPSARLVDLCHDVPPQDVRRGAFLLASSLPYFPHGTIFLVVVDPGVGTARRPLAIEAGRWRFVGPDNGVFAWALRFLARDGHARITVDAGRLRLESGRAAQLNERRFWRPRVSSTFHGRDIFAPVAAELSLGRALEDFGPSVDDLVDLPWPEVHKTDDGTLIGEVITVDGYGNLVTNLQPADLLAQSIFEIAGRSIQGLSPHFQSQADLVAVPGSSGFVEIAAPNASAATILSVKPGAAVRAKAQ
jgi:S-adenosylmethionine hydrolase